MIINTNFKCCICNCSPENSNTGRLVRDHNHRTGLFRGMVCDLCNSYLSLYEHRKKRKGRFRHWCRRYKVRIRKHLNTETKVRYFSGKRAIVAYTGFVLGTKTKLLCKHCGMLNSVIKVNGQDLTLSCGHVRSQ